jgi:ATP-dependent helicase/DNAse subunit B
MAQDEFSAIWVSHSSLGDFMKCPRSYYLKNIYKNPKTRRKISLMQPPLALGQAIHATLEQLSTLPTEERFKTSLLDKYNDIWKTIAGKKGGFLDDAQEKQFKERGTAMIEKVIKNPGPLTCKTIKIKQELPHYWLSEKDNIILCGKIDWLVYREEDDTVQILDFKSGKHAEKDGSLQLPIYYLLAKNCQSRKVTGVCYWYLERDNEPMSMSLPSESESYTSVLDAALRVKLARQMEHFKCPQGLTGCVHCAPLEVIVNGQAEFVGLNDYNQEIYILNYKTHNYSLSDTIEGM